MDIEINSAKCKLNSRTEGSVTKESALVKIKICSNFAMYISLNY